MLLLPLPARPDWSRPPVATLLLIALCVLAFFMQGNDGARTASAWRFYQDSGLAGMEFSAYAADLAARGKSGEARPFASGGTSPALLRAMEDDVDFMARLRGQRVIAPGQPEFAAWQEKRRQYEALRARVVTAHYGLSSTEKRPVTVLTHLFLHGGVMHLAGNMAILFMVGYTVEAALGSLGFLALYFLGGLGAAFPDLWQPARSYQVSIGASGAVSAVMAAYLALFGWRRINFFYWAFFFFGTVRWPALAILPVWLMNELLQKYVFDAGGQVNYLAHFAGFLSGALLIGVWRWRRQGRSAETVHRQDDLEAVAALRRQAGEQVARMQFGPAALVYRRILADYPVKEGALFEEYLRIARLARQPELIADAMARLLAAGAASPPAAPPRVVAEALEGGELAVLPKLSAGRWEALVHRLIEAGETQTAETLLLRLMALPGFEAAGGRLAERLANAFQAAGQGDQAAAARRLGSRFS